MRTLITGINGFVGGHLSELLLQMSGWEIWGVDRATTALPSIRQHVHFVSADLCNADAVRHVIDQAQPQVIFHLAGQTFVPESFKNPAATMHTNITAQLNLFQALIEQCLKSRVLVVGSYEEYGMIRPEDVPINEQTPLRPTSPYGVSKIAQNMLALQYHISHQLDVVRVRPFNHIGPRQSDRFVASSFAQQIARIEQGVQPPTVNVGDLSPRRDFTDVRDMVRAYVLAVESGIAGEVYNLGSGNPVTIQTLLDILVASSTAAVEINPDPERMRPVSVPVVACDASRFRTHTGWHPAIALETTLHDILEDMRERVSQESSSAT